MPDIRMCQGGDCPLKDNCYRFTATPNEWRQSYFSNTPWEEEEKNCEYYIPVQKIKVDE